MTLDPVRASMLGTIGQANRWAKCVTPEARRAATQKARDAQHAAYLERARAMTGGADLTPDELVERARQLRLAFLATMRLRRFERRQRAAS
jgi:hypothetical protein